MKKTLLILIMTLMSFVYTTASANNFVDNTDEKGKIEYIMKQDSINYLYLNMPAKIRMFEDREFNIRILTSKPYLKKMISYYIDKDELKVQLDSRIINDDNVDLSPDDIQIFIYGPKILKIKTSNRLLVAENKNNPLTNNENN